MLEDTLSDFGQPDFESLPAETLSPNKRNFLNVMLYTDSDIFAGTERHIMELARGLRQENVDVAIACPAASPLNELASRIGSRSNPNR